jgi:hypothetical protein
MLRSDKKNNYPIEVFDFTLTPTKYDQTTQGANYGAFYQTDPSVYPNLLISIDADGSASNQKYARVIFTYSYSSSKKEQFEGLVPFDRKNPKTFVVNLLYENPTNELIHDDDYNVDYGLMEYTSKDDSITWNSVVDQLYTGDEMTQGDYKSFYDVTQHYMWLMANTDPYKNPASGPTYIYQTHSGGLDTGLSNFNLQFKCDEQVKYLYITEGKLNTGISSRGA